MKTINITAEKALDLFVMEHINRFEQIHHRLQCNKQNDPETGDEYVTVYDPETDRCLTLWYSPTWHGSEVLRDALAILRSKAEGGAHGAF